MTLQSHIWETGLSEAEACTKQEPSLLHRFSEGNKTIPIFVKQQLTLIQFHKVSINSSTINSFHIKAF